MIGLLEEQRLSAPTASTGWVSSAAAITTVGGVEEGNTMTSWSQEKTSGKFEILKKKSEAKSFKMIAHILTQKGEDETSLKNC